MRPFDYTRAATVDETLELLGSASANANGAATQALAGGTDLLTRMKADLIAPEQLVDIKRLDDLPEGIEERADGGLSLGALTRLSAIEQSARLRERCFALSEAASLAATPQLRNMATLGGNLLQRPRCWYYRNSLFDCWLKGGETCPAREGENQFHALFEHEPCCAVHPSDLATALMALDASVRLRGTRDGAAGERTLPLGDFFALPEADRRRETVLGEDELLLSVEIPPTNGARSTYFKAMDRKAWAFALVSVAAVVRMDGDTIADARLVLGGVAPIPWRVSSAERLLIGSAPSDALFTRAADAVLADAEPLAHNGYKVPLLQGLIRQALAAVAAE